MENKQIKKILKEGNVKFTIEGYKNGRNKLTTFSMSDKGGSVWNSLRGMNVGKFGSKYITLYSFDMLGTRTIGKIKYKDIKIIEEIKNN
tara:strand:+ start:733 stop:999 length:267 start_codon:yes stop_codon:yes gene_type:complete